MKIKIFLVGLPKVEVDGKEVFTKISKKLLGVVFYLAANQNKSVSKSKLCELFWYDSDESDARTSLRQTLYLIKKYAKEEIFLQQEEDSLIISETDFCRLNSNLEIWVDITEFKTTIEKAEQAKNVKDKIEYYKKAMNLCPGIFLDDFYIRENAQFEEWAILERERINLEKESVCRNIAILYQKESQWDNAIVFLKKLLEIDPLLEDVHLQLMQVYYNKKERGKAINQFHQCTKILSAELNISPMPEIRNFYNTLLKEERETVPIVHETKVIPAAMHQLKHKKIVIKSHSGYSLEYGDIYEAFKDIIKTTDIPDYLKLGLSKVFPQYSAYASHSVTDSYFACTLRECIEEIAMEDLVTLEIQDAVHLDEKSKFAIDYLWGYFCANRNHLPYKMILL